MPSTVKTKKTLQKKKPIKSTKAKNANSIKSDQDYYEMIAEAAYYKAEQRGFIPGYEEEDWLEAENEIMSMLRLHWL